MSRGEYTKRRRVLTLLGLAVIFPVGIPVLLVFVAPGIDVYFHLSRFSLGVIGGIGGIILVVVGSIFALWSNYVQFTTGQGTPIPIMPPRRLLVCKPYSYCRNPMSLGAILLYSGISILIGSPSAVYFVALFTIVLVTYIKVVEEKGLVERYGGDYLEYKKRTPFLVPRLREQR
ncbi:MAG: isoprenylcysteine carboxylmethyltransferase family protein [Dehalogenimonas sp.]